MKRTYGCLPDKIDERDLKFRAQRRRVSLPAVVDSREWAPDAQDQDILGACCGTSTTGAYAFRSRVLGRQPFDPSALFAYYNLRVIEGTVDVDAGGEIRDAIKALAKHGVCREDLWPYLPEKFAKKPPKKAYSDGLKHQAPLYEHLNGSIDQIRAAVAVRRPVVFGFCVFESFEGPEIARTGQMLVPEKGELERGWHAVWIVGYDDLRQMLIVQNSWSTDWGDRGYFYMPYEFAKRRKWNRDFWTLEVVE